MLRVSSSFFFFFFNDTATTEIYTLSLHDALPIFVATEFNEGTSMPAGVRSEGREVDLLPVVAIYGANASGKRSEEHTSELQSQSNLVCRLLLEKKKKQTNSTYRERMTSPGAYRRR